MKKSILTLLSISILLLAWQLLAMLAGLPDLIPSVPRLLLTLADLFTSESFYRSVAATLSRGIAGMLISLVAATSVAFLFSKHEWVYELFRPLLAIMRSVPVISFILLALIFLNAESIPLLIAFLTMFPLLAENLTKGIRSQRKELLIMARQFGIGRWNKLAQIIYPQLKPFLYSGLASAAGFGWRAVIMGEVLAQCTPGIGGEMKQAQTFIDVPGLMAWTIAAILISYLSDKGISRLAKLQFHIRYTTHPSGCLLSSEGDGDIRIDNISYRYDTHLVLSHFSSTFAKGTIYGIKAPSGAGKTTLFNLIRGILQPEQGKIETGRAKIANVFQEPELLDHLTVKENISLPLAACLKKEIALHQAEKVLEEMEMVDMGDRFPCELSFGQQQRVAIARALAYPAPILLMDEPFKGLEEALKLRIIERIIKRQTESRQTILFSSHDPNELHALASQVISWQTPSA